jgi:hypothetical protein
MIIDKHQAYELANALLNAVESVDDTDKDQVVIQFDSDTIISTTALDDGYDEGYTTLARVVGSS